MYTIVIVALLIFIIVNLFHAFFIMIKGEPMMSRYLGRRVFFSVVTLLIIILALASGLITPNSNPFTERKQTQISTTTLHQQSASTKPRPERQSVYLAKSALS